MTLDDLYNGIKKTYQSAKTGSVGKNISSELEKFDYFKPSQNVRVRDFVREVPTGVDEAMQGIARGIARFWISLNELPQTFRTGQASGQFYNTPVGRVNSFQSEAQNRVRRGDPLWKAIGNPALDTVLAGADVGAIMAPVLNAGKNFNHFGKIGDEIRAFSGDMTVPLGPTRKVTLPGRVEPVSPNIYDSRPGMGTFDKVNGKFQKIGGFRYKRDAVPTYIPPSQVDVPFEWQSKTMQSLSRPGLTIKETPFTQGMRVKSLEKGNVGTIMSVNEKSGTARVFFKNKKEGTKATVEISLGKLSPLTKGNGKIKLSRQPKGPKSQFSVRVAESTSDAASPTSYQFAPNEETLLKSKANMSQGRDFAMKQARNEKLGAEANATAMSLMDEAISAEKWDDLDMLLKEFSPRFSKQGQEIQILSRWGRLTPSGAVNYTQHLIDKAKQASKTNIDFSNEAKKEIVKLAEAVQQTQPGTREHAIQSALLMKKIAEQLPSSLGRKVSTIQTMAQLLNPKTFLRNVIGNTAFSVGEFVSDTVAAPIDKAVSLVTGQRTKVLPSPTTLGKGLVQGFKEGSEEARLGIDIKNLPSQFDVQNSPVFSGKIGQFFEKGLSLELKPADRAFYQSAFDDTLRQQMKIANVTEPTEEMLEIAHEAGLYRTFQDESNAARLFSSLKKGLNLGKDWGLGDIVLKYPKTPGNLLARAIDYSPAGYTKALFELAKPLFKHEFNQKAFVEALSRGSVGSAGLVGLGAILGKLGLVTGSPADDKDIANLERAQGQGQYKLNISGLKRLIFSGFDAEEAKAKEGDTLMTYDWLQPFAVPLSIGANAVQDNKLSTSSVVAESIASGANTLAEQPLVQGMKRMFGYGDIVGGLTETVKGAPASFVPTLSSQFRQLTDNSKRQLQGGGFADEMKASMMNKVPGVSEMLPQAYNTLGQPAEMYQNDSNNWFNVFFNPAFMTQIETTPGGREAMSIFNRNGSTEQAPRTAPKKIKINGQNIELSAEQISKYQEYVGTRTSQAFDKLTAVPGFMELPDEQKTKLMANVMTDIATAAKVELFGHKTQDWRERRAAQYMSGAAGEAEFDKEVTSAGFADTDEKMLVKDGIVYRKTKDGKVQTMTEPEYNEKLNQIRMVSAKRGGNLEAWFKAADEKAKALTAQLNDPNVDELDRLKIEDELNRLADDYEKFSSYHGFTKPKKGKKVKVKLDLDLKDITPAIPKALKLTSPKIKLSGTAPKIKLPRAARLKVPKLRIKQNVSTVPGAKRLA